MKFFDGKSKYAWVHCQNPENGNTFWTAIDADPPMQYPQSLGELCLELAAPKVQEWVHEKYIGAKLTITLLPDRNELHALRRAMWHRSRP